MVALLLTVFSILSAAYIGIPLPSYDQCTQDLPPPLRAYCCDKYALCPPATGAHHAAYKAINNAPIHERIIRVRTLSEKCSPLFRCAAGLLCRGGRCRRNTSYPHIQALRQRGRAIEREEKEDLIVEGQMVTDGVQSSENTGLEEDELSDNIADFLKGMKVNLTGNQRKGIREIIAGTLDERAEREEQVDTDLNGGDRTIEQKPDCGDKTARTDTCVASS